MVGYRCLRYVVVLTGVTYAEDYSCNHCKLGEAFTDLTKPEVPMDGPHSTAHHLWASQVEVVHLDKELGGFLPKSFSKKVAEAAISGWADFKDGIVPKLRKRRGGHPLVEQVDQTHAGALNDAFFIYQKNLFEKDGHLEDALNPRKVEEGAMPGVGTPGHNTSWPSMDALPEYQMLRKIIEKMSRRYLRRAGLDAGEGANLDYSLFNWWAVNSPGEFHGPHTHVGEYHVGVFYAQVGHGAGKIRFGDPRGQHPPFGSEFALSPSSGDLVLFPSWLKHMATVTAAESDPTRDGTAEDEPKRVILAFNIGPAYGPLPCFQWWSDPTSDMTFKRSVPCDLKAMGLQNKSSTK